MHLFIKSLTIHVGLVLVENTIFSAIIIMLHEVTVCTGTSDCLMDGYVMILYTLSVKISE